MNNGYATDQIEKQQPVNKNNLLFSFVTLDIKGFPPPYTFGKSIHNNLEVIAPFFLFFCVSNFNGGGKEM